MNCKISGQLKEHLALGGKPISTAHIHKLVGMCFNLVLFNELDEDTPASHQIREEIGAMLEENPNLAAEIEQSLGREFTPFVAGLKKYLALVRGEELPPMPSVVCGFCGEDPCRCDEEDDPWDDEDDWTYLDEDEEDD